jgi:L-ectoine synthase
MITRKVVDLLHTGRHVTAPNWESTRLLLAADDMGFSMHVTRLYAGRETPMWYRHHLEAVYCVEGKGEVITLSDGQVHPIEPGTLYALNRNDRHILRTFTEMVCVCVFNPPLWGREVHDQDGAYARSAEPINE